MLKESQMMHRLFEAYKLVVEEYQISAEEVAQVIVDAADSNNPDQTYLVGKYSKMMEEVKRTMSYSECYDIIKEQFLIK
jgi:predicted butyrate kinase (DUF1464 family)